VADPEHVRHAHYATPSSGDPDEDARALKRIARNQELIDRGRCPNDDGDLRDSETCVRCGSAYATTGSCSRREDGCQGGRGEASAVRTCPTCGFILTTIPLHVGG